MAKFSQLRAVVAQPGKVARFPVPELTLEGQDTTPTLLVVSIGRSNRAYQEAIAARQIERDARRTLKTPASVIADSERDLDLHRSLIAKHAIIGWENVLDAETRAPVAFTAENVGDLLAPEDRIVDGQERPGLPDTIVLALLRFVGDPVNFAGAAADPAATAGF